MCYLILCYDLSYIIYLGQQVSTIYFIYMVKFLYMYMYEIDFSEVKIYLFVINYLDRLIIRSLLICLCIY